MYYRLSFSIHKSHKYRHTCLLGGCEKYTIVRKWLPISSKQSVLPNWICLWEFRLGSNNFQTVVYSPLQPCAHIQTNWDTHLQWQPHSIVSDVIFVDLWQTWSRHKRKKICGIPLILLLCSLRKSFSPLLLWFVRVFVYAHWHWLISF